jgi:hypothetical protein
MSHIAEAVADAEYADSLGLLKEWAEFAAADELRNKVLRLIAKKGHKVTLPDGSVDFRKAAAVNTPAKGRAGSPSPLLELYGGTQTPALRELTELANNHQIQTGAGEHSAMAAVLATPRGAELLRRHKQTLNDQSVAAAEDDAAKKKVAAMLAKSQDSLLTFAGNCVRLMKGEDPKTVPVTKSQIYDQLLALSKGLHPELTQEQAFTRAVSTSEPCRILYHGLRYAKV